MSNIERRPICKANLARVDQLTRSLIINDQQLELISKLLQQELNRGLHRDTNAQANIKMYPTHLIDHHIAQPTHSEAGSVESANQLSDSHFAEPERGKFLALDLGGTNFRVILAELDDEQFHMDNETCSLSQELMHGPGHQLFDYIADCLYKFLVRRNLNHQRLPLGFTFSFPVQQERLAHARLVTWTKGFKCPDVEGRDVVGLLREAIERRPDLDIEVMAVVNDTTATLVSCAFKNRECRIGLIVGTGTNACYMEDVHNVHAMHPRKEASGASLNSEGESSLSSHEDQTNSAQSDERLRLQKQRQTVINTEWGAFGDDGLLDFARTKWDDEMDAHSVNKGKQKFEKMISGLYIGELCRRVMQEMSLQHKLLFRQHHDPSGAQLQLVGELDKLLPLPLLQRREQLLRSGPLGEEFGFETRFVSLIESDPAHSNGNTRRALEEALGIDWASDEDCAAVKLICTRVSTRAAHLVSAAVACLLRRMARPSTVVAVDGSMFKFHPHFHSTMARKTEQLAHPHHRFQVMFCEDGSGKGAAIAASVACKQRRLSAGLAV